MAESYVKKEFNKKKLEKRKEKEQRREERKQNNDKGKSFNEMIMYVDEYGRLVETPLSQEHKIEVELSEIQLGAAPLDVEETTKKGIISFLNEEKQYGFITSSKGGENIFFHLSNSTFNIKKDNTVSFEITKTPKGLSAVNIQLIK